MAPPLQAFGRSTAGLVVLAGSGGFTPARLLLVPASTPLPPLRVHAVSALPATPVASLGSGTRAMGLVADHGILSLDEATNAGTVASLCIDEDVLAAALSIDASVLAALSIDASVFATFPVGDSVLSVGDATDAGLLASLPVGAATKTGPAAGGPPRGTASGLLFLGAGDASTGFTFGTAVGRASPSRRGGRLVAAATAGSETDGGDDNGTKVDLFLKRKKAVLMSWEYVDVDRVYNPQGFSGDLKILQQTADKGMVLMRGLLDAGLDYNNAEMWLLSYTGQCQSDRGFVDDGAVTEATHALQLVCVKLLPGAPVGSVSDPRLVYSQQRLEAFTDLIGAVEIAVKG